MNKTRKYRKISKKQKKKAKTLHQNKKRYVGGLGENIQGFPLCNKITLFDMDDSKLLQFSRHVKSKMDCFISALQIFGLIPSQCANIMRLAASDSGSTKKAMETIFVYLTGLNYCFRKILNFDEFKTTIESELPKGKAVFVGYDIRGNKHVFIIARKLSGEFCIIDPQAIPGNIAPLDNEGSIRYLHANIPGNIYYILTQSETRLNEHQIEYVRDIANGMSEFQAIQKYNQKVNPRTVNIIDDDSKMDLSP